jgi:ribosomal protein S18 acetylase RimI-like enzyme
MSGLSWHDRYRSARAGERVLRRMTPDDIPAAVALAERLGWQQEATNWQRLLSWSPDGCFVLEEPEVGLVGTVSTTPYGTALGWIGTLMVSPDRQRQGLGRELMRAALDHLIARGTQRIMLDSTEVGRGLYHRLGFRDVCKIERWEGRASTYLGPRARRMRSEDRPAVFALDRLLFGLDRQHILSRLMDDYPDLAWVDYEGNELQGFLLGHRRREQVNLGPWMSLSLAAAERLLRVAFEQLQGQTVVLHLPDHNGRSLILASNHNLRRTGYCTRMIYGDAQPIQGQPLGELAIASLATG